jgi:hypothetical protein
MCFVALVANLFIHSPDPKHSALVRARATRVIQSTRVFVSLEEPTLKVAQEMAAEDPYEAINMLCQFINKYHGK